jgi:hypothetical protein
MADDDRQLIYIAKLGGNFLAEMVVSYQVGALRDVNGAFETEQVAS